MSDLSKNQVYICKPGFFAAVDPGIFFILFFLFCKKIILQNIFFIFFILQNYFFYFYLFYFGLVSNAT